MALRLLSREASSMLQSQNSFVLDCQCLEVDFLKNLLRELKVALTPHSGTRKIGSVTQAQLVKQVQRVWGTV